MKIGSGALSNWYELKFVPQDCWIGIYWDTQSTRRHWYIILIPTIVFVIHQYIEKGLSEVKDGS